MGVIALLALGSGCAASQEARRDLLERTSAEVAYKLPAEQVMDAARAVLDEQGYVLSPGGGPHSLKTQWKLDGDLDTLTRWSKVLVIGQYREDGRFVVRTQQVTWVTGGRTASHPSMGGQARNGDKRGNDGGGTNSVQGDPYGSAKPVFRRALDVEWAILQRLEPQFAAHVEQQVDLYLSNSPR
jgi:hypothetical protein